MEKRIRFKPKDAELWKRIKAVYPDKSAEYKKEVYDFLCSEAKIARLKDHVAILEKTETILYPWAMYGKDLKKRAKENSSKGGGRPKGREIYVLACRQIITEYEIKTPLECWKVFAKKYNNPIDTLKIKKGSDFCEVYFEEGDYDKNEPDLLMYFPNGKLKNAKGIKYISFKKHFFEAKKMSSNK